MKKTKLECWVNVKTLLEMVKQCDNFDISPGDWINIAIKEKIFKDLHIDINKDPFTPTNFNNDFFLDFDEKPITKKKKSKLLDFSGIGEPF